MSTPNARPSSDSSPSPELWAGARPAQVIALRRGPSPSAGELNGVGVPANASG